MPRRAWIALAALALVIVGLTSTPHWAIAGLVRAAQTDNFDAVADYVDFERLRQNLKGQVAVSMQTELLNADTSGFATIGAALGAMMADRMIETMVTPEVIAKGVKDALEGRPTSRIGAAFAVLQRADGEWLDTRTYRMISMDGGMQFTWRRSGLSWRLTSFGNREVSSPTLSVARAQASSRISDPYFKPDLTMPAADAIKKARQLLTEGKPWDAYGVAHRAVMDARPNRAESAELEMLKAQAFAAPRR